LTIGLRLAKAKMNQLVQHVTDFMLLLIELLQVKKNHEN
jgi:hypothetical protein